MWCQWTQSQLPSTIHRHSRAERAMQPRIGSWWMWPSRVVSVHWAAVKATPLLLLPPIILLCMLCGIGCWSVLQSEHVASQTLQDTVKRSAEQVIQGWQAQLTASYQSLKMLAVVIETFPNWDDLLVHMPPFAVAALASVPPNTISQLQIQPFNVISDVYPKNPISLSALGLDLMALGSKGMSELIISTRQIEFQGPLMLYEGYEAVISQ
ncbi:hypothetical protein QJQ45_028083, partial [Haematococcus lacustris]